MRLFEKRKNTKTGEKERINRIWQTLRMVWTNPDSFLTFPVISLRSDSEESSCLQRSL